MISIGAIYTEIVEDQVRLCSRITVHGKLDHYRDLYDLDKFQQNKNIFLARALMHTGHPYEEDMEALVRKHITVTPQMEQRARMLSAAVRVTSTYFEGKQTDTPFAWK